MNLSHEHNLSGSLLICLEATHFPCFIKLDAERDGWYDHNAGSVYVIVVTEPQHNTENLENVERIEDLQNKRKNEVIRICANGNCTNNK